MTRLSRSLPLLLLLAACVDDPTAAVRQPEPTPAPRVLGVYEFTLTGIGTPEMRASVAAVPSGPGQALNPLGSGVIFESMSTGSITHGTRGQGGQRYISYTYRVRNSTGAAIGNLTMIPVTRSNTIAGTPFSAITLQNGTAASASIAPLVVPAGAVSLTDVGGLRSTDIDVLQVFEESEIAAITPPAGVTGMFPYGFVVRNPSTPGSRTLPHTTDTNQFSGALTFAFRYPLQSSSSADPYTMSFQAIAIEDTETRVTESIEEGQDSSAVRQVRDRAAALGATTVTVLAGSTAADAAVTDYPGQRQICPVRTAGAAGSPTTTITAPGAYALLRVYRTGETMDACGAYFRGGTATPAAYNMQYALTLRAMDLYGNVKTAQVDTVRLEPVAGPAATVPAPAALTGGAKTVIITYSGYGTSVLRAVGRRNRGAASVTVAGMTRIWTGNADTDWGTGGNWDVGVAPGPLDTAYIPAFRPFYPVLTSNVAIGGVTVTDGVTVSLNAFDLTAGGDVAAGATGGITSTTGRLILAGSNNTVRGRLPRIRVTGVYSVQDGALDARGGVELAGGRLQTHRQLSHSASH